MVSNEVPLPLCSGKKRKHKIEDTDNCVEESARLKEIQGEKDLDQMDQSVESMDCISRLPDHVIHHILSLLRNVKDIIRTSILSKRWRALWYSFSILVFDERKFTAEIGHEGSSNKGKMFRDYVSSSLHTHLEKNLLIQRLVVHMTSFDLEDAPHVDHWLSVAIAKNIKELDVHVGTRNSMRYTLPQTVFSSKTLTGLRLSSCILETCSNIMLPHLQKLYLRKLRLVEHIIQNLISSCHSIEDLRFIQCSGLKYLHVSNLIQLNRVEIHHCNQLKKVEISAPNLHTFWYCGKKSTPCKVSLEGCKSLKRLTLEHPQVTRDFCENQISKFPLLEKLDLTISEKMKVISISNPHLKRIALKGCKKLVYAHVAAPNLLSFEYKGENMPYIEFSPFCLTDAKLSIEPKPERKYVGYGDKIWFFMRYFILRFDFEGFKLVIHSDKHIIIHEDLNHLSFPPLTDLSFEIIKSSACIEDTLYSLLRTLHPVSLSIVSPFDSKFPKLVYEMIKVKDEDPICCSYNTSNNKCWRHFLKDVKFEDLKDITSEEIEAYEDKRTSAWNIFYIEHDSTALLDTFISVLPDILKFHLTSECYSEKSVMPALGGGQDGKGARSRKKSVIVGPWGGNGGTSWDDGTFTGVRQVTLVYDRCIDSIRVVYDKNGKPFTTEKHGGVGGNKTAEIKLQYPDEYLISVSGHYCPVVRGGTPVIRSLTFKSNRRTFGPYGVEEGTPFTFSIDGGQVVGFKGRGEWYLDSLAFTLSCVSSKSLLQKVQRGLYRLTSIPPKSLSSKDVKNTIGI